MDMGLPFEAWSWAMRALFFWFMIFSYLVGFVPVACLAPIYICMYVSLLYVANVVARILYDMLPSAPCPCARICAPSRPKYPSAWLVGRAHRHDGEDIES
jgi:hypothetical protein